VQGQLARTKATDRGGASRLERATWAGIGAFFSHFLEPQGRRLGHFVGGDGQGMVVVVAAVAVVVAVAVAVEVVVTDELRVSRERGVGMFVQSNNSPARRLQARRPSRTGTPVVSCDMFNLNDTNDTTAVVSLPQYLSLLFLSATRPQLTRTWRTPLAGPKGRRPSPCQYRSPR